MRRYGLRDLNTSPDTPDLEKIWSEGNVLVMSGPVSRPYEGYYVMLAILEPVMCIRYTRERSFHKCIT